MATSMSLQRRVLWTVLTAVVLVWLTTTYVVWRKSQHELDELLDGHLAQAAALLVVQQAASSFEEDEAVPDAPTLHRYAPRVIFQVWHEGRLVRRSARAPATPLADGDEGFSDRVVDGAHWRVFSAHGAEHDVVVHVGEQVTARAEILRSAIQGMLAALVVALPLLALLVWAAVRQSMTPLSELARLLLARSPDAAEPVHLSDVPAEMAPVLAALNALFMRIEDLLTAERRFTADAAHELRTPIAAIRTQAQVAWAEADADKRRHALQATLAGCDRAARLIDQLLMLARLESGRALDQAQVDLAALARRVVTELAGQALDKAQDIELIAPASRLVEGHEALLAALLRNLVDNAIRYSPSQARIRVHVHDAGEVWLEVDDSGPGLSEADLRRLGERFFRGEGQPAPGSGLGWSIVTRIAAAHGCHVVAMRSTVLGGLRVQVVEGLTPP